MVGSRGERVVGKREQEGEAADTEVLVPEEIRTVTFFSLFYC